VKVSPTWCPPAPTPCHTCTQAGLVVQQALSESCAVPLRLSSLFCLCVQRVLLCVVSVSGVLSVVGLVWGVAVIAIMNVGSGALGDRSSSFVVRGLR
jgi:hypothetical protein